MSQGTTTQQSALVAYPKQSAVDSVLPKNKLYKHGDANTG